MKSRRTLALLFLLLPSLASAQEAPERLLSEKTQVYLRWDGLEAHRAAFEKTAHTHFGVFRGHYKFRCRCDRGLHLPPGLVNIVWSISGFLTCSRVEK